MKGTMLILSPDGRITRTDYGDVALPEMLDAMTKAVGGYIEKVPHFGSIEFDGAVRPCHVLCNEDGKLDRPAPLPRNIHADALWAKALQRDFNVASPSPDYLVGNIVILFGDDEFMEAL